MVTRPPFGTGSVCDLHSWHLVGAGLSVSPKYGNQRHHDGYGIEQEDESRSETPVSASETSSFSRK